MRRSTRLGLIVAVLSGCRRGRCLHDPYRFAAAGRIEGGVRQFAQSLQAHNLNLSWRAIQVGGFPLAMRVELSEARVRDRATTPTTDVQVPLLSASARPWNPLLWQVTAADGLSATASWPGAPSKLAARRASGSVRSRGGGATMWLSSASRPPSGHTPRRARRRSLADPAAAPPAGHTEPEIGVALDVRARSARGAGAVRQPDRRVAFGMTVNGGIPAAPAGEAAAACECRRHSRNRASGAPPGQPSRRRQRHPRARSGPPAGRRFSGAVGGYDELMSALVSTGQIREGDARLGAARARHARQARAGGKKEIATSFTVQDGEIFLGPASLGKAPGSTGSDPPPRSRAVAVAPARARTCRIAARSRRPQAVAKMPLRPWRCAARCSGARQRFTASASRQNDSDRSLPSWFRLSNARPR